MLLGIEFQILAQVNLMDFWVLCSLNNGICNLSLVVDLVEKKLFDNVK